MRKPIYLLLALAAFAACNKEPVPGGGTPAPLPEPAGSVTVVVDGGGDALTRATGVTGQSGRNDSTEESKVNTLQVFVFKGGQREAYRSVSGALEAKVPANEGERTVWAVVNGPDLSGVMTLDALKVGVTRLGDNTLGSFVMSGGVSQKLVDGGTVKVSVRRHVARVSIAKITTDLKDYRKNYSVRVSGIYLINVPGDGSYDGSAAPASWVNKLRHEDTNLDALLYDEVKGVTVSNSKAYSKTHYFYPYPNPWPKDGVKETYDDKWNERGTMLVIEAAMLDAKGSVVKSGYYPLVLPALERNKTYAIGEVCITRLPGDVPYKPIETGESVVTVTVNEWETGLNLGNVVI